MSYKKYTVTLNATIVTESDYSAVTTALTSAAQALGTVAIVNAVNVNQWVDPATMKPQEFNSDGSFYTEETADSESEAA